MFDQAAAEICGLEKSSTGELSKCKTIIQEPTDKERIAFLEHELRVAKDAIIKLKNELKTLLED
jgi:protein subunit release factor A